MPEPVTQTIDVPGATLTYDVRGDLANRPVLLVIGSPMGASGFPTLASNFEDRTVVTYDPRGVERSVRSGELTELSPEDHAGDLIALIEHLDVGPVHYAGLSMGGFVGLRLGARRPDLVRSLTLIDTSAGPEDPSKVAQYRLLASIYRVVGLRPLRGKVAPIMFSRAFLETPEGRDVLEVWSRELAQQGRRGVKLAIRGVTDRLPVLEEISSVKAPTLVIAGSEDVATPTDRADLIAELIPDAESVTLPGVGHVSTLEAPQAVNQALIPFLAAH